MRLSPPLLLSLLLAGCTNGYALDYVRPKTSLIGPQLTRYGLSPAEAQCVGQRLGGSLTVWQLRQFADAARRIVPGGAYPDTLTSRELLWAASHVEDKAVAPVVERVVAECGIAVMRSAEPAPPPPPATPPEATPPVAEQAEAPPSQEPTNGPANYQPSETLWAAFGAYEKKDYATAARLARTAAEAGDSAAQQFLGALYASGQGVKKDPAAAVTWYARAAEAGWSEAMNNLGRAFETGQGVPRDLIQALKWYLLASARPADDPDLIRRNIQNVSGQLTTAEIEQAATLARQWEQARRR